MIGSRERGQSGALGFILLFAIVTVAISGVIVVAGDAIGGAESNAATSSATASMERLQSVTTGGEPGQGDSSFHRVSFAGGSDSGVRAEAGHGGVDEARAVRIDKDAGHATVVVNGDTAVDTDLGAVLYEKDGEELVYQGGGVFRQSPGSSGSVVVSAPTFNYRYSQGEPTLTFGITTLSSESDASVGNTIGVRRAGTTNHFPTATTSNPLDGGDSITITVQSSYYQAWADVFRQRTENAEVSVDDGAQTVTLELSGDPQSTGTVEDGFVGLGSGAIANAGHYDSYQSSSGSYSHGSFPVRENGDLAVTGNLETENSAELAGALLVGGDLTIKNDIHVFKKTIVGGDLSITNTADLDDNVRVAGDLSGGKDTLTIDGDVIVGSELVSLEASAIQGSLYVHGPFKPTASNDLKIDDLYGSVEASQSINLENHPAVKVDVHGDIVSGQDATLDKGVVMVGGSHHQVEADRHVEVKSQAELADTDIVAGDDVVIRSDAIVHGDIDAGDDVVIESGAQVDGDVTAGGTVTNNGNVGGTVTGGASPESPRAPSLPDADGPNVPSSFTPADTFIDQMRYFDDDPAHNDNDDVSGTIADLESSGDVCNPCTLPAGNYHLDRIDLDDERLVIQTNDQPVNIYVEGPAGAESVGLHASEIEIQGEGQVELAIDGGDLQMDGTTVDVPNDDANQFWIYTMPGASVTSGSSTNRMTGVLYGADGTGGGTSISLTNENHWRGAILGEPATVSNDAWIHYDESLADGGAAGGTRPGREVAYLQIRTTEVVIRDESG